MKPIALNNPEVTDALLDVETGLTIARTLYTSYFEKTDECAEINFKTSRNDIGTLIGAVIDYMRSAQVTLEAIEENTPQNTADREESSQHTTG